MAVTGVQTCALPILMIGTMNGKIVYVPFAKAIKHDKGIDRGALELVKILSI